MARKKLNTKTTLTVLDIVKIEAGARRQVWIEQNCPQFKGGRTTDRKKAKNKKACRGRVSVDI